MTTTTGAKKAAKKATSAGAKQTAGKTAARTQAAKKAGNGPAAKKGAGKRAAKGPAAKKTARRAAKPAPGDHAGWIALIEARAQAAGVKLPKGASETAIASTEKVLGFALPEEVRAWYRAHNGGGESARGRHVLGHRELLTLKGIVVQWKIWKQVFDDGFLGHNRHGAPGRGVQRKWWIPQWVPVTHDGAGNLHVVDLAPMKSGVRGQIVTFWREKHERIVVGRDLLSWLAKCKWNVE